MSKRDKYRLSYYIVCSITAIFFTIIGYQIVTWQWWFGFILVLSAGWCGLNMGMKEEYPLNDNTEEKLFEESHCETINTISASCISRNRGISESNEEVMIKECLCGELAKQLLPYLNYEKYPIVDEYNSEEVKHVCTIRIVN